MCPRRWQYFGSVSRQMTMLNRAAEAEGWECKGPQSEVELLAFAEDLDHRHLRTLEKRADM